MAQRQFSDRDLMSILDDQRTTNADLELLSPEDRTRLEQLAGAPKAQAPSPSVGEIAADVGRGAMKGVTRSVVDLGQLLQYVPGVSKATDWLANLPPGGSQTAFDQAHQALEYKNAAERVGGMGETAAEMLIPISKAAEAVPSAARAGKTFQTVMSAAKNVPVNTNAAGQVALRIQDLAERGGSMPMAVRKFANWITDPNKPPMTYEVARDFASNISRLSADEYKRLTPVVGREVANLRVALNQAVGDAAKVAGKGAEYRSAMREYAQAMKIRDVFDSAIEGAKKGAPFLVPSAAGGAAGVYLAQKLKQLLGGGE